MVVCVCVLCVSALLCLAPRSHVLNVGRRVVCTQLEYPAGLGFPSIADRASAGHNAMQRVAPYMPNNACQRIMRYLTCQVLMPTCNASATGIAVEPIKPCATLCHQAVTLCGAHVVSTVVPDGGCTNPALFSADTATCAALTLPPENACPLGCNAPHGTCSADGVCVCEFGYYGVDCTSQHCEGVVETTVPAGGAALSFKPAPDGQPMRGGSNCTWVFTAEGVAPPSAGGIVSDGHLTLNWSMFNTGWTPVSVFNGYSTQSSALLRMYASEEVLTPSVIGENFLQPVMSLANQLTVNVRRPGG